MAPPDRDAGVPAGNYMICNVGVPRGPCSCTITGACERESTPMIASPFALENEYGMCRVSCVYGVDVGCTTRYDTVRRWRCHFNFIYIWCFQR